MSEINLLSFDNLGLALDSPGYSKARSCGSIPVPRQRLSFRCSKFAMDKAAQGGHVDVLKLLHSQVIDNGNHLKDTPELFRAW